MGGVVARLALEEPGVSARVATLVTLGTPHAGTHLARLGNTGRVRHLRPDSDVVKRLEAQLPWRSPVRLVAFHSAADIVLLPHGSARVDGAENVELARASRTTGICSTRPGGRGCCKRSSRARRA